MLKNIVTAIAMLAAVCSAMAGSAQAALSEPSVVYYGTALNADPGSSVTLALNGSLAAVASCTVGADHRYVLRVPMDALAPRLLGTAITGDAAAIFINGVLAKGALVIPARGTLKNLDLGARSAEQWAKDHPGYDGSGDMVDGGGT